MGGKGRAGRVGRVLLTVSAAVFDIGAVVAVAVTQPVVRHRIVVAVVDEEGVVVDAVLWHPPASAPPVSVGTLELVGMRSRPRKAWVWRGRGSTHEEVDHLVDGERAAAVVVEERVERLELRRPGGG